MDWLFWVAVVDFKKRRITLVSLVFLGLYLALWAVPFSYSQPRPPAKDRGSLVFSLENDVWLKQDEGYTNGVQLMWVTPELSQDTWSPFLRRLERLNRKLLGGGDKSQIELVKRRASLSLVQGIFTPDNLTETNLIPDDRPYAGLLYAALGLVKLGPAYQDSAGLALGWWVRCPWLEPSSAGCIRPTAGPIPQAGRISSRMSRCWSCGLTVSGPWSRLGFLFTGCSRWSKSESGPRLVTC